QRQFACDCVDFRINGLGTCKHVEAVLWHLEGRFNRLFKAAAQNGAGRLDVVPDPVAGSIRLHQHGAEVPRPLKQWFDVEGHLRQGPPEESLEALRQLGEKELPDLRLSQELAGWLEARRRVEERTQLRRQYELRVQSGEWPAQETKVPLFPYQREGM